MNAVAASVLGGEPGKSVVVGLGAAVQDMEAEPMNDIVSQMR